MKPGEIVKNSLESILKINDINHINSPEDIVTEDDKQLVFNVISSVRDLSTSLDSIEPIKTSFFEKEFYGIMLESIDAASKRFPEWTNFNKREVGTLILEIMSAQLDKLFYLGDQIFTNNTLPTLNNYESLIWKAQEYLYALKGRKSAIVNLLFKLDTVHSFDVVIPEKTVVSSADGLRKFETLQYAVILAGSRSITVNARNHISTSNLFNGQIGIKDQRYPLNNIGVINDTVVVTVGNKLWTLIESILLAPPGEEFYALEYTQDENMFVVFGNNDDYGKIPEEQILVRYAFGGGIGANSIQTGQINKITSTIFDSEAQSVNDLTVTNRFAPTGGENRETIESGRKNISVWNASSNRSITREEFEINAVALADIQRAFVIDNPYTREKDIPLSLDEFQVLIYVVPGIGIAVDDTLKNSIIDIYTDASKRPTFGNVASNTIITEAIYQDWDIDARVFFENNSPWLSTINLIRGSLETSFGFTSKKIDGSFSINWGTELEEIPRSRIIALIENFRGYGVTKVLLDGPVDDLAIDQLSIPRLINITLTAFNKDGTQLAL